jgi:hypothetical protein
MLVVIFAMRNHEELYTAIESRDQDASQGQSGHEAKQYPESHHIKNYHQVLLTATSYGKS